MVLQKCFVEHRAKQQWLISMDTDEFWRAGRTTLRAHLEGAQKREEEKTQVPFCRGHLDTTGNLTTVAAQKYAMRSMMCMTRSMLTCGSTMALVGTRSSVFVSPD